MTIPQCWARRRPKMRFAAGRVPHPAAHHILPLSFGPLRFDLFRACLVVRPFHFEHFPQGYLQFLQGGDDQ